MTEEVKCNVDDMKDFAHQAKLEMKIRGRNAKLAGLEKAVEVTGHELTMDEKLQGAKMVAADKMHNLQDFGEQARLEVGMKARDAKMELDKTAAKKKLDEMAAATGEKLADVKDALVDSVTPATKSVEATSTRGVDISHVENSKNATLETRRAQEIEREQAQAEREREEKRQAVVDAAKAKAASVGAAISHAADVAAVALGEVALSAKEKIDESTAEEQRPIVKTKINDAGMDLSSVANARNEELAERDRLATQLAAAQRGEVDSNKPASLGDKISAAAASVKETIVSATTDSPAPIYVAKMSEAGIDVSHVENARNAELAKAEETKLQRERELALQKEKELLKEGLVDPLASSATRSSQSLGAKLGALGDSLSKAASHMGHKIAESYQELAHPLPLDVHEKRSENGIDTTSIANANNHALGEQMKYEHSAAGQVGLGSKPDIVPGAFSSASAASAVASAPQPQGLGSSDRPVEKDGETAVIKGVLDGGVVAHDSGNAVKDVAKESGSLVKEAALDAKIEAKKAGRAVARGAEKVQSEAARVTDTLKADASVLADKIVEKVTVAPTAI